MRIMLIGLALAAVVGCQPGPSDPVVTLRGVAVAGPMCPVETDPPDPACDDRPVGAAEIIIRFEGGREVERVRTDADGTFSVDLVAGRYEVIPQPVEGLLGTAATIDVILDAGGSSEPVTLLYDTGIR